MATRRKRDQLRHYKSTPDLDMFQENGSTGCMGTGTSTFRTDSSMPKMITFSTFSKNGRNRMDMRFADDPNPYSVTEIHSHKIRVHNPFSNMKSRGQQIFSYSEEKSYPPKNETEFPGVEDNKLLIGDEGASAVGEEKATFEDEKIEGHELSYDQSDNCNGCQAQCLEVCRFQAYTASDSTSIEEGSSLSSSGMSTASNKSSQRAVSLSSAVTSSSHHPNEDYQVPEPNYNHDELMASADLPEDISSVPRDFDSDPYFVPNLRREDDTTIKDKPSIISACEKYKIERALKGRKTIVFVSDSMINLYASNSKPTHTSIEDETTDWNLMYTGVPVLLLDTGETKSRDKRKIQIVVAEYGSGLALWKDVVDNLSNYSTLPGSSTFHTMHFSGDHMKLIGLSFEDALSADKFVKEVERLTSNFANISLSGAKIKGKKGKIKSVCSYPVKLGKYIKPRKSDISQPCSFHHISSITTNDKKTFPSLQNCSFPLNSQNTLSHSVHDSQSVT